MFFIVSFIDFQDDLGIFIHFLVRLSNNESFFSLSSQYEEFNGFLLCSLSFTVICNHLSALWQLRFCSEDVFCLLGIIQMVKVQPDYVLPVIGSLISCFGIFIVLLTLLGFCHHDQDRR